MSRVPKNCLYDDIGLLGSGSVAVAVAVGSTTVGSTTVGPNSVQPLSLRDASWWQAELSCLEKNWLSISDFLPPSCHMPSIRSFLPRMAALRAAMRGVLVLPPALLRGERERPDRHLLHPRTALLLPRHGSARLDSTWVIVLVEVPSSRARTRARAGRRGRRAQCSGRRGAGRARRAGRRATR